MQNRELKVGEEVVVLANPRKQYQPQQPYRGRFYPTVGSRCESIGKITNTTIEDMSLIVSVEWDHPEIPGETSHDARDLMPFEEFKKTKDYNDAKNRKIFKSGDIVYVVPTPRQTHIGPDVPCIGSPYETDLKVIRATVGKLGMYVMYKCYSPGYGLLDLRGDQVVDSETRFKIKHKEAKNYILNHPIKGIATSGTEFIAINGYLYDAKSQTTAFKITDTILQSFTEKK